MAKLTPDVVPIKHELDTFSAEEYEKTRDSINAAYDLIASGGTGILFSMQTISPTSMNLIKDGPAVISFTWSSTDVTLNLPTGNGSLLVTIGDKTIFSGAVGQGQIDVNIKPGLVAGANVVNVKLTDSYSNTKTITYSVNVVELAIKTSYDISTINTGEITFRYTPIGTFLKTVHFILDGVELTPVDTTDNNVQKTKFIPAQSHGVHRLEVYITAIFNGSEIRSNTILVDIVSVEAGNTATIIAVDFQLDQVEQYVSVPISFFVYNPLSLTSAVDLKVNGVIVSSLLASRSKQVWNFKPTVVGELILSIESNGTEIDFPIEVTPSTIDVEPVTQDLQLFLSSQNRNNSEINRDQWKYSSIEAVLTGFNWYTNGWIVDDQGSTALRVADGASVNIPFKPFMSEVKLSGKTLEFEFKISEVKNYDAVLVSCMSGNIGFQIKANSVVFQSEQSSMSTNFKEDERVRISFVINKTNDNRLLFIYINGIFSAVQQYPALDNFIQSIPQNIVVGSPDCNIGLYTVRVYNNNLNQSQLLENYIFDLDDVDRKVAVFQRNDVFNNLGVVDIQKALLFLPCMIMTGILPTFKGDKKNLFHEYINLQSPAMSFKGVGQVDVQGTSSQYYPRKNWKSKMVNFTDNNGVVSPKYAIRPGSIKERTFTFKADFAESSGTHNTGFSRIIDTLTRELEILTPPQIVDAKVRTTIDGFPMLLFHRNTADAPLEFVGKYNFNNDKGNEDTFGFDDGDESWEVTNNTSDNILFKGTDFTSLDDEGNPLWLSDYEARFPEDNLDVSKLSAMQAWVVSTLGNPTKFRDEAADWFNMDNLLFYYVMTELIAAVDQRGKNMMMTYFAATQRWYFIFYDSDTILGLNNEGAISFGYNVEYHDTDGSGNVWNAESSTLWNNVEAAFQPEIAEMYARVREVFTYEMAMQYFNVDQSDKWGEAIFNEDAWYKYILPLLQEGQGTYLYAAQGSRVEWRKWWVFNRFRYLDGKYNAASFLTDYATMRLYTPITWAGVAPNANFVLTAFSDGYTRMKYGSYVVKGKLFKNNTTLIVAPPIQFNDTETINYGMGAVKSLGDLAPKYVGTLDVTRAVKLVDLKIGSTIAGYKNSNLISLAVGNNKLLGMVNISNCDHLTQPLDLSGCTAIRQVYAKGSKITSVILPEGGILQVLHLPRPTSLVIKNQILLTVENLQIENFNSLSSVIIENCPSLNFGSLISKMSKVIRFRLIGINGSSEYSLDFFYITRAQGIDENGNTLPKAVLEGTWHFENMYQEDMDEFNANFPDFNYTYDNLIAEIVFESPEVQAALEAEFGPLTLATIRAITSLNGCFQGMVTTAATAFDEFRYFTSVESIGEFDMPYNGGNGFKSVTFPSSLKRIENNTKLIARSVQGLDSIEFIGYIAFSLGGGDATQAFADMERVAFPNVTEFGKNGSGIGDTFYRAQSIGILDFSGSTFTELPIATINDIICDELILPETLKIIRAYSLLSKIGDDEVPNLPEGVEEIYDRGIFGLGDSFTLPTELRIVGANAFRELGVRELIFNENVQTIGGDALWRLTEQLVFLGSIPPTIGADSLQYSIAEFITQIYVPDAALETYKTATNWTILAARNQIHPMSEKPAEITGVTNRIVYETPAILTALQANGWYNAVFKIWLETVISDMQGCFTGIDFPTTTKFNEFQYFTAVTELNPGDVPRASSGAGLASIHLPASIRKINYNTELNSRIILGTEPLTHLAAGGFGFVAGCSCFDAMTLVKFENLIVLEGGAPFKNCSNMGNTHLNFAGSTFTVVNSYAFNTVFCKKVTLPNTLVTLSANAITGTIAEPILLPNSIEFMGDRCLKFLYDIDRVLDLPQNLLAMDHFGLTNAEYKRVIFSENITSIGYNIENYRTTSIVFLGITPPSITAFTFTDEDLLLYVPDAALATYKAATNWSAIEARILPMSDLPPL